MKPHMSVATTPGTAYGMKIAVRENRLARVAPRSSSSANSRARPSVSGTAMSAVDREPAEAGEEVRVGERGDVVVEPDEHLLALAEGAARRRAAARGS